MLRPNSTAEADATGFKTCTICRKRKVASRDPSESCFYLVTRPDGHGNNLKYYKYCCKECSRRLVSDQGRASGNAYARNSRLRMLADPIRKAKYNAGKATYYRRNRERELRTRSAYRRSAIGKLVYARWQNNKRLVEFVAADEAGNVPQNARRIARLKELIAAQDAEITRIKARKQAEMERDASPKEHGWKSFKKLINDIYSPG